MPVPSEESEPNNQDWEAFDIDPAEAQGWEALGFGAFDAAVAYGDGFTPRFAVHYRRQLLKTADSWRRVGLDSIEGLCWHRAGFATKEATRWRSRGADVETARVESRRQDRVSSAGSEGPNDKSN